jgi:hypothetical protein
MKNVRRLTFFIFAYTTVEGLVVNMMYPNTLPFIFKDVAIVLAYLAVMSGPYAGSRTLSKLTGPLLMFGVVTVAFFVMPSPVSFMGELVAVKQRLLYIPLIWVGYHVVVDETDVFAILKVMAWSAIPASIFGIYLYFTGPAGLTSLGANYSAVFNSTAGEHGISFWRVPGTFTSPGQYGGFLLVNGILFVGTLFMPGVPARQRTVTMVALVVTLGALLVSGSRAPLLLFMMGSVFLLMLTGRLSGIGIWAGGLYGVLTVGFTYFGDGVRDRVGSIASWEHVSRFEETYFGQLFWRMLQDQPMGFGLGRATIGARHFSELGSVMLVESYLGIIVAETGFIGLIVFLWMLAAILATLFRCHTVMRNAPHKAMWYSVAIPVVITISLLPISTVIDSAPGNLYFYFFLGTAIRLYDLELERRRGGGPDPGRRSGPLYTAVSYQ